MVRAGVPRPWPFVSSIVPYSIPKDALPKNTAVCALVTRSSGP